jgi:hypothetical protein
MSDDLDDLLRAAMKTLDDQVPSGYFEGLPNRTLMRLEDSSMQTTGSSDNSKPTGAPPPEDGVRDEDSGLHDIRSMASSTKMRLSSKRISTHPPVDDDLIASSSGSWKAVALPEPAKMVSLPELDRDEPAPSSERKSKKELKAERTSASKIAKEAIAVETSAAMPAMGSPAPAMKPADLATPMIGARFAQPQKKSKSGLYAMLGVGLAAAAGVGWYVSTQMDSSKESASSNSIVASSETDRAERQAAPQTAAPIAAPAAGSATVTAIAEPTPAEPKADEGAVATGMSGGAVAPGADEQKGADAAKRPSAKAGKDKDKKREEAAKPAPVEKKITTEQPKDTTKVDAKKKDGETTDGEPSFDALLKEAGVQDKKPEKVALEKKSLSGADIKKGMSSVAGKAQACYAGQQGTAQVKLTVAPDGTVQKVAVTGVFAGTPVGACVASAVKSATFPAWEGGPQSFGYSYLLAE